MKEAYLDFLSKSLHEKAENPFVRVLVFSIRYAVELDYHNRILDEIMVANPKKYAKVYRHHTAKTEGGNGLADICLDPLLTKETRMPSTQEYLFE